MIGAAHAAPIVSGAARRIVGKDSCEWVYAHGRFAYNRGPRSAPKF
jgi:hypothetical protein